MQGPNGKRVDCPHAGGTEGKHVAERRKLQDEFSVQDDKYHSYKRNEASKYLPFAKAFALVEDATENHDEERVRTDDERNVAAWRNAEGCIFGPEVKRASGDAANEQD